MHRDINSISEQDNGMYDAINKGLARAQGDIIAYLNCDEQYLNGTLSFVIEYFKLNKNVDVLFGSALIIDPRGKLLAFRKAYRPRWYFMLASHLYVLSCTMFFRRRIVDEGLIFNSELKDLGDLDFVVRILRRGYESKITKRYLSAFTITGKNMSSGENAQIERENIAALSPKWIKVLKLPLNLLRFIEKMISGAYFQRYPFQYAIYDSNNAEKRRLFQVHHSSFRWPRNLSD
jgi:glycosyltransferase involved in cell wall biosynthesis